MSRKRVLSENFLDCASVISSPLVYREIEGFRAYRRDKCMLLIGAVDEGERVKGKVDTPSGDID